MIANISHQSSYAIGWGTLALINVGLTQSKKSQWYSLVLDLFTAWTDCDILYCDIGIRSKEVRNAGHKAVGIMKGDYFYD